MPGKKPKERQRYKMTRLWKLPGQYIWPGIRLEEKSDTRLKKCRGMEYAVWRNYRKKAMTALFR